MKRKLRLARLGASLLLMAGAVACGGASDPVPAADVNPDTTPNSVAAAAPLTSTTTPAVMLELEEGLPRTSSYSIVEVTVTRAVLADIEPRTYLRETPEPGPRHLFLDLTVENRSETDTANWLPTPFALLVGEELVGPPEILEGRPNIGLSHLNSTEMVIAFPVSEDTGFEDAALVVAQPERIPMILPLVGEVPQSGFPINVDLSGAGPAQGTGVGCRQDLDIEVLGGSVAIDLLEADYPTNYGSRRARVGERFLTVGLRVLNNGGSRCGGGSTNFGNTDVRLLIDGTPREPVTFVNTAIGVNAAVDLSFHFVYPVDASELTLTVGSDEATLFAIPVTIPPMPPLSGEG